jgi:hypothetical protein
MSGFVEACDSFPDETSVLAVSVNAGLVSWAYFARRTVFAAPMFSYLS